MTTRTVTAIVVVEAAAARKVETHTNVLSDWTFTLAHAKGAPRAGPQAVIVAALTTSE